jgi:hypothetical protein
MGLINMNQEDRERAEAEILGLFTQEDALVLGTYFLSDVRAARGWLAGCIISRQTPLPFSYYDSEPYHIGAAIYGKVMECTKRLSAPVRDAVVKYITDGADDWARPSRFRVEGQDADVIRELLNRPLPQSTIDQLTGDNNDD